VSVKNDFTAEVGDYEFTIEAKADGGAGNSASSDIVIACKLTDIATTKSWSLILPDTTASPKTETLYSGMANFASVNDVDCQ
jgi:hypothetical protein